MDLKPLSHSLDIAYQPHPVAPLDGRRSMISVTDGTASVRDVLLSAGVDPHQPIVVQIDGKMLTVEEWDTVRPTSGQLINVTATVAGGGGGSNPLQVVAMIAVIVVAAWVAGPAGAAFFGSTLGVSAGTAATVATIAGAVVAIGGSLLIGALFPPKSPTAPNAPPQVSPTYSLSGGQNRSRIYEPMPVVMGKHRMFLDYAARPYTEYRGDDQYLYQVFSLGLGDIEASQYKIGTTAIEMYSDYRFVQPDANGRLPDFPGNVDSAAGAPLTRSGGAIIRTTSHDTYQIGIDIESTLFIATDKGDLERRTVGFLVQYRKSGDTTWITPSALDIYGRNFTYEDSLLFTAAASQKPNRATIYITDLDPDTYDVRIERLTADTTDSKDVSITNWSSLRSYQLDEADYDGQNRIGLVIRASEQLSGVVQQLSALVEAKATYFDGQDWVTAETSNPAHWFMHFARGVRNSAGKLLYGVGLPVNQIDLPALTAWANFCAAEELTFNGVIDSALTAADVLTMFGTAGFASPSWGSGKLGVVFDSRSASPVMAFGMPNIIRDSFEVAYISENLAEEIVVRFRNPDKDYDQDEVRALAPDIVSPIRSSAVDLFGCTDAEMAGKFANYLAAQQYYRRRRVMWQSDFEGFVCQRGDVVLLSHDLTQWGYSGRLIAVDGQDVTLDRAVPRQYQTEYLMLIRPDGTTITYDVNGSHDEESDTLEIDGYLDLQDGFDLIDHRWCFSPLSTPGKRLKILSVQPASDSRLQIIATDEYEEFYDAWDGTFVAPTQETILPKQPVSASNLTMTSRVALVGGYLTNRVAVSWDVSGATHYSSVRMYLDGDLIKEGQHAATQFEIDVSGAGALYVEVTPVGLAGTGITQTATLNLHALDLPAPPQTVELTGEDGNSATFAWTPVVGVQSYVVEIFANSAVRRTVNVGNSLTYTYSVDDAIADGGPFRSYSLRVYSVNQAGQSNTFSEALFSNPQIGQLQNASLEPMPNSLWFKADKPVEPDFAGIKVWVSSDIGFTPSESTLAYDGPETFVTISADAQGNPLVSGTVYLVRAAGYDTFGDDNLTLTAELSAGVLSPAWGLLEGDIDKMLLDSGLRDRIDKIDGIESDVGGIGDRIDLLDMLPVAEIETKPIQPQTGLVSIVRSLSGEISAIGRKSESIAEAVLNAVLKVQGNSDLIYDAGVRVDSSTGQVYIFGVKQAENRLDTAEIRLDAAEANINLRATTNYVDQAIIDAVLDPSQIADLSGLNARVGQAEIDIDGLDAAITLKADLLTVNGHGVRLGQAEIDIDALESAITLKASNADLGDVEYRVSSAEVTLNALDVPGITQTITDVRSLRASENDMAQTQLRDILTGEANYKDLDAGIARARRSLTAYVDEGLGAEAAERLLLETQVDGNASAIQQEAIARANAIDAEAQLRVALSVAVGDNAADILQEAQTRADEDAAISRRVDGIQSTVGENRGLITSEATTRAEEDIALAGQISTVSATANAKNRTYRQTGEPSGEFVAGDLWFDTGDSNKAYRYSGSGWVATDDKRVAQNTAAIQSEAITRADEDGALSRQINTVQATANAKTRTYSQAAAPTNDLVTGDLWFDTSNDNKPHRWNGSAWVGTDDARVGQNVAAIQSEANTRANADTALSERIDTLTSTVGGNTSAIQTEAQTRANADGALSSRITTAQSTADGRNRTFRQGTAPAGAVAGDLWFDTANDNKPKRYSGSAWIATEDARIAQNFAAIQSEASTRAGADSAMAGQISALQSTVGGHTSAIQNESITRADEDEALASQIGTVQAVVTRDQNQIAETQLADMLTGEHQYRGLKGGIAIARQEIKAYTDGEIFAEAQARLELQARLNDTEAALSQESLVRAGADGALAGQISSLASTVGGNTSAIQSEAFTRAQEDGVLSGQISTISATANAKNRTYRQPTAPSTDLVSGDMWFDTSDGSKQYRWSGTAWEVTDDSRIAQNVAAIQSEASTRADADSAMASQIGTLQSTVGGHTTSIQTVAQTVDGIQAKYTVKVDNNGYVAGYGLISAANNGAPYADFAVIADRFSLAPVATSPTADTSSPFFVLTAPTTIDGVSIPAGSYLKKAFIHDATITTAKIEALAVTGAKIANATITTAKIGNAQITDAKIANATITTAKIGDAQITNAKIADLAVDNAKIANLNASKLNAGYLSADRIQAGSIVADKIDSRGLTIKDASGNIIFGASQSLDWSRITSQPANIFNGNVTIGSDGQLIGAGGGKVSLGGLGAGAFATLEQITAANATTYIGSAAIGTALIANAAITNAKIDDAAITSAKIDDAAITTAKIKDADITTAKIKNAAIETLKLAGNSVTVSAALNITTSGTYTLQVNANEGGSLTLFVDSGNVNVGTTITLSGAGSGSLMAMPLPLSLPIVSEDGSGNVFFEGIHVESVTNVSMGIINVGAGVTTISIAASSRCSVVALLTMR